MTTHSEYLALAKTHNYSKFTALQDVAFHSDYISDPDRNLFISGVTSSGKTLIPMLLYEMSVIESMKAGNPCPKMLFIVPYRALAAQKSLELENFFKSYSLKIVQSTGEYRHNDRDIRAGNVDVAVMITEKAFNFQAYSSEFLGKYDFLVLDEVGLVNNEERGSFYDFLFFWGSETHGRIGRPRIVALGTPFYNWDSYIETFGLSLIAADAERPVSLEYNTIVINNSCILKTKGPCDFLRPTSILSLSKYEEWTREYGQATLPCLTQQIPCPVDTPCRTNASLLCKTIDGPCTSPVTIIPQKMSMFRYILFEICRHHLLLGHQILIFMNSRNEVVDISMFLYQELSELPQLAEVFPEPPSMEECREEVLSKCKLHPDDVYGILEFDDGTQIDKKYYRAIWSGVAFHSAALPNEMRTYVEERLLSGREMKIVCSTETLAFGVNSTVDVVVVAKLDKQENANGMITMNEYMNYAGRAGRLRPGEDPTHLKGTVYTLVREKQEEQWEEARQQPLKRLVSVFYSDIDEKLPLFLLNLIPDVGGRGISFQGLLATSRLMPKDDAMGAEEMRRRVYDAVGFLVSHGLLEKTIRAASGRRGCGGVAYLLTELGRHMRGYILNKNDFETLWNSVDEYINGIYLEPDFVTFLFRLLSTRHAASALNSVYEKSETKFSYQELRDHICAKLPKTALVPEWINRWNEKELYVLGAVLAWCEGESAKSIYRNYGMHYALLNRLTEQISYLVEIAMKIIPNTVECRWRNVNQQWKTFTKQEEFLGFDRESADKQCEKMIEDTKKLAVSLYFGINPDVHQELMEYLEKTGEEAEPLRARYALHGFEPRTAKEFRSIVYAYSFFSKAPTKTFESTEERNNFLSLRRQQYLAIKRLNLPLVFRFFCDKFGVAFTDTIDWRI